MQVSTALPPSWPGKSRLIERIGRADSDVDITGSAHASAVVQCKEVRNFVIPAQAGIQFVSTA